MPRWYCLRPFLLLCLTAASLVGPAHAASITLYDDSAGNTPGDQPWLLFGALGGAATETPHASGVNLLSDDPVSAGYSNTVPVFNVFKNAAFPTLDRTQGFSLSFELLVTAETHGSPDRAGFSVILIGDDLQGIEIGFWEDEVWAQDDGVPLFTHGEGAMFDTTAGEALYELAILGSDYVLSAAGNPLFQGGLRDYSSFGVPYSLSNYLFLGDDTSSAAAEIILGDVILSTGETATVPTPSALALLLIGLLAVRRVSASGGRRPA